MFKKIIPKKTINFISKLYIYKDVVLNYFHDAKGYIKYSTTVHPPLKKSALEARIIAHYHVVEKGLSFEDTRPKFGQNVIFSLIKLLKNWEKNEYPTNDGTFLTGISVLREYINWHEKRDIDIDNIKEEMGALINKEDNKLGGTTKITKKEIDENRKKDFNIFSKNRHSVRNFSSTPVPIEKIKEAIDIAQRSPSACNRQSVKAYCIKNKEIKNKILKLQEGNRGFGHLADKLLIITTDLSCYNGIRERNLGFIDGGIFSMSLMYSLHYKGIDSCALGWLTTRQNDSQLKKMAGIKKSENIVLLLTLGYMKNDIKIAKSTKKAIDKITII